MKPLRLRIQNFRSIRAEQTLDLDLEPGLYFMQGLNEAEPRLDANGAGKSTVWDALCWLFFEKTPRGLKAGDVCNWDAGKGTRVELEYLTEAEEPRSVWRTWKPNAWKMRTYDEHEVDLSKGEHNPVLADLMLEMQPFLSCVLMAQGQGMFLDMKSAAQAELFGSLMRLDRWIDYAAGASRKASDLGARAAGLDRRLAGAEGRAGAMSRGDLKSALERWYAERSQRLDDLAREHEQVIEHSYAKQDLKKAQEAEDAAFDAMRRAAPDEKHEQGLAELRASLKDAERVMSVLESRLADADEQLGRAERGEDCRSCGQPLGSPAHVREAKARWESADDDAEVARAELAAARAAEEKAAAILADRRRAWEKLRDAASDAQAETRRCRSAWETEMRLLDCIEDEAAELRDARNPHEAAARREEQDRDEAEREAAELRRELDDCDRQRSIADYWVRGFKEVRLALVAEALAELEVEANSACEALGLSGWELRFQVDRETKGGGVQRGFSVLVRAPGSPGLVPWEAWSGGESQRLRLAAQMGLADLIRARTGATFPLEVWDEPTVGLSAQGVQDLLEALAARARAEGRIVWLVDHRTRAFGGFAGGAMVTKGAGGSAISQAGV